MKFLLTIALCPVLAAAETVQLKAYAQPPGSVLSIRSSTISKDGKITVQQGRSKTEGAMSIQRSRILEQRIVNSGASRGISYKIIEDTSVGSNELGGPDQTSRRVASLTGETAAGFQDPLKRWHLYLEGKTANNSQAVELAELEAYANRRYFVNRPVKVGDSWPVEPAFIRHLALRDLGDAELSATMTLEAVKEVDGIRTAVLGFKLQTVGVRDQSDPRSDATALIDATGKVHVTLETMLDRRFELDGTLQSTNRSGDTLTTLVLPFSVRIDKTPKPRP